MKTLYINTTTSETTIAIFIENKCIAEKRWLAEQNEAELLQPSIASLLIKNELSPDDISQLVVCTGPGGFTNCRIGVSAANAWSFAKDIPITAVTIFDLYSGFDGMILVTANSHEAWLQTRGTEPQFVERDNLRVPSSYSFTGIINTEWKEFLEDRGGSFVEFREKLPTINQLFETRSKKQGTSSSILPWYYKNPNITWSTKNIPTA